MSTDTPLPPAPAPVPPTPPPKKRPWLLYGCGGLLALSLIIIASVAITIWWIQRPIKPVVLTAKEQTVVQQKLDKVEAESPARPSASLDPSRAARAWTNDRPVQVPALDRPYVPGAKEIRFTEREINGLLNQNTDLGKSVRIEFARDAVNAYLAVPIPQDFPVMGGKMFRARGRFAVSIGNGGAPYAVLEDVTIFGISMPKAWLGGLKGENLLQDAVGQGKRGPILRGIKSLRVDPGALVLELED